MKKIAFIAVLLLSVSFASAQINFGIKAGYKSSLGFENISSVNPEGYILNSVESELNNGFHGGAFARFFINKMYIQPELLYALQKKEYQFTYVDYLNQNIDVNNHVTFSTVEIPLLLGYQLLDLKTANLRVFAGPKIKLNAGSNSELGFNYLTDENPVDENKLKGEFKDSQIGLEAGMGIDVAMITLDFRFNLIKDLYQASWETKPDASSRFIVSLGWKIF